MSKLRDAIAVMNAYKASLPKPKNVLGNPPWSRENLEKACENDYHATREHLETHPGHALNEHIQCLTQSFRLFDLAVRDLITGVHRYQHLSGERGMQSRRRRNVIDEVRLDLEKNLFTASQAALALVDHSRRISGKVAVLGYDTKTKAFAEDPEHRFIQGLRACLFHVFYVSPTAEVSNYGEEGMKARFLIPKKTLLKYDGWDVLARTYLDGLKDNLDLERFLTGYREKVRTLQSWFVTQLRHSDPATLENYLDSRRLLRAMAAKMSFNFLLRQVVIQQKRDAFDYLDRFLDPQELERVYAFPFRSKAQVNYIITLMDEDGACDDELRATVYEAFKVN